MKKARILTIAAMALFLAVILVGMMISFSGCQSSSVITLNVYNWGEYISDGSEDSLDVNAAFDPTFSEVFETNNSSFLNKGCVLTKYTGARGKSGSNDASAETMAKVIAIMEKNGVYWQAGELGAVDDGGGGTIAKHVAHLNIDVVDLGVPIISMHSPFELSSKLDVLNTYKAFCAFYK